MPGDMALVITLVRACCAVVWWCLSWFEVIFRMYRLFIPTFIRQPIRKMVLSFNLKWEEMMTHFFGTQYVNPCVVVFSYEASQRAQKLLGDIGLKPYRKVIFIYSEHDIRRLVPLCEAYMVFIDYNEENVILEHEAGHNALHLYTVKALREKAYGSVSVVYLDDKGPPVCPEDHLFNPSLSSVYAHPVLGVLQQQRHLFTVKKEWNHLQRRTIHDWLSIQVIPGNKVQ